jgi:hypothetical protein
MPAPLARQQRERHCLLPETCYRLEPLEFCRRSFEARVPRFQTMRTGDRSVDRQFERVEYAVYPFASAGETRRSDNV